MASNIISETINAAFPVAGVDNDTQGFRDNFSTIKDSLASAKSEIESLQDDTAKINASNDFSGNDINDANFVKVTDEWINVGTVSANLDVTFNNGHYQVATISNNVALTFVDWPASGRLAKMRIELIGDNTERTITFATEGGGAVLAGSNVPATITVNASTDHYIYDVWTFNGGNTIYVDYVGVFS